ncbi:hypothetical protein ATK17_3196 [Branchiibius hedensis]|uniref:ParB-like nuclease domain-containing protein n=1 Tax=Branchiibius hedensis TaxID=672460 RepID=A0A2Y9BUJ5_9MICO|nr:hypothetical protein ATK17_3196 [Branchiibius hedensis]SSA35822.1 hypothetical protein SAMN04489750_3196 [Branchiibius hedensis]
MWEAARIRWQVEEREAVDRVQSRIAAAGVRVEDYLRMVSGAAGCVSRGAGASSGGGSGSAAESVVLPAGFEMISVDAMAIEGIHGDADFRPSSPASDMRWAVRAVQEVVLPTLLAGGGREELATRDAVEGRNGNRSYAATYDGFFGSDAPVVERLADGSFSVTNGRHRGWCAQQLGIATIPARVLAGSRG